MIPRRERKGTAASRVGCEREEYRASITLQQEKRIHEVVFVCRAKLRQLLNTQRARFARKFPEVPPGKMTPEEFSNHQSLKKISFPFELDSEVETVEGHRFVLLRAIKLAVNCGRFFARYDVLRG